MYYYCILHASYYMWNPIKDTPKEENLPAEDERLGPSVHVHYSEIHCGYN